MVLDFLKLFSLSSTSTELDIINNYLRITHLTEVLMCHYSHKVFVRIRRRTAAKENHSFIIPIEMDKPASVAIILCIKGIHTCCNSNIKIILIHLVINCESETGVTKNKFFQ